MEKRKAKFEKKLYDEWRSNGRPTPVPHIAKQMVISKYRERYALEILVESGTYMGDMIKSQKSKFKKLYSIELSKELFEKAKVRFSRDQHIKLFQGDSGTVMKDVAILLNTPALFWLDGHYSGGVTARGDKDCPIYAEVDGIFDFNPQEHVLLVDDARLFVGEGDYPSIDDLTDYIQSKNSNYKIKVEDDIIIYFI